MHLGIRGTDVGKFNDVGFGLLGERPQFRKIIRDTLLVCHTLGEGGDNASGQRNIPGLNFYSRTVAEQLDDGQERESSKTWRFIGLRIDDLRGVSHRFASLQLLNEQLADDPHRRPQKARIIEDSLALRMTPKIGVRVEFTNNLHRKNWGRSQIYK